MDSSKSKTNYYFLDNKAYTEDDLLVYNIFVYQIPKKVTSQEAYSYFSQFGDVLRLRLYVDNKCSGEISDTQVGFVNFSDPVVAASVLQRTNHVMQKKRIFVKACDSWEQPEAQYGGVSGFYVDVSGTVAADIDLIDLHDYSGPLGGDNNNIRLSNILQLNDDCLEVICKKLQLRDQVRFARVCQRFRCIFRRCCKWQHKVFEMNKLIGMTLWDIRDFFEMAGNNIERMTGAVPYNYQDRVEFIGAFSPNVKSVNFNCNNIESGSLLRLLEKMNAVTDLQLHNFALNDNAVLTLRNLPNLKILMLKWSYELTGKNLDKLTDLRELSLYGCENLQNVHFINICKSLKELKTLDIRHCKMLTTNAYNEMVKNCYKLQVLKISCQKDVHYECVAYLGNLKRLEVHSFSTVRDELFTALAERRTTQTLEYLEILARNCITYERSVLIARLKQLRHLICPFNDSLNDECLCEFAALENLMEIDIKSCRAITNAGLLVILRKCAHIRRINVERCENVNDAFVFDAIEVLQQCLLQQLEPKELVQFDVCETGIHECILNNNKFRIAEQLLKLSFTNTITD